MLRTSGHFVSSEHFSHFSWLSIDAQKRCNQVFRQSTRTNVSGACDHFSLIHAQARKLDRQRRLSSEKSAQQKLSTECHEALFERLKSKSSIRSQNLMLSCTMPHASDSSDSWALAWSSIRRLSHGSQVSPRHATFQRALSASCVVS